MCSEFDATIINIVLHNILRVLSITSVVYALAISQIGLSIVSQGCHMSAPVLTLYQLELLL